MRVKINRTSKIVKEKRKKKRYAITKILSIKDRIFLWKESLTSFYVYFVLKPSKTIYVRQFFYFLKSWYAERCGLFKGQDSNKITKIILSLPSSFLAYQCCTDCLTVEAFFYCSKMERLFTMLR